MRGVAYVGDVIWWQTGDGGTRTKMQLNRIHDSPRRNWDWILPGYSTVYRREGQVRCVPVRASPIF
jgi:hypothetical protein